MSISQHFLNLYCRWLLIISYQYINSSAAECAYENEAEARITSLPLLELGNDHCWSYQIIDITQSWRCSRRALRDFFAAARGLCCYTNGLNERLPLSICIWRLSSCAQKTEFKMDSPWSPLGTEKARTKLWFWSGNEWLTIYTINHNDWSTIFYTWRSEAKNSKIRVRRNI